MNRKMIPGLLVAITFTLLVLAGLTGLTHAQSGGGYDLTWGSVDGGGGMFSSGGGYSLGGTSGQPDAGTLGGSVYTLAGGFWGDMASQYKVYLPLVQRSGTTPLPPVAPSNLITSVLSSAVVNLQWQDNSSNEDGFYIEQAPPGQDFSEVLVTASNVTTANISGLSTSTTYRFRVRAHGDGGYSSYSNVATARTLSDPPVAPSNLITSVLSSAAVNLQWQDNSSDEDGFYIEQAPPGQGFAQVLTTTPNVTTTSVSELSASTNYRFRVRAHGDGGYSSYSNVATAQTLPNIPQLVPPSGLVVTATASNFIEMTWHDNANNEDGYYIDLSTNHGATFELAYGTLPVASYTYVSPGVIWGGDDARTPGTEYCYRIRAYQGTNVSNPSTTACATTPPNSPPNPPSNLYVTVMSSTQVLLTWTNNSSSTGSDGFGYRVYESDNGSGFDLLGNIYGYYDGVFISGVDPGHTYAYKVTAFNNYGASALSATSNSVTTPGSPETTATRLINNSSYPIVSLIIDGVEQFPTAPQGIPPHGEMLKTLSVGSHTYSAANGFWYGGSRQTMYTFSGTFTQQSGVIGQVTFNNPTIAQLLTRFGSSGYWVGMYWLGTNLNSAAFRFYSNGTYVFYNNGVAQGTGTYSLVSYPGSYMVTFSVNGGYQGILDEMHGYFHMDNGPSGWRTMQYTYDGP